jgi:hypothetical protein
MVLLIKIKTKTEEVGNKYENCCDLNLRLTTKAKAMR